jgi:hypothetical protein
MDPRTIGQLITGFGAKLLACGLAIWCACTAASYIIDAFAQINHAFGN